MASTCVFDSVFAVYLLAARKHVYFSVFGICRRSDGRRREARVRSRHGISNLLACLIRRESVREGETEGKGVAPTP